MPSPNDPVRIYSHDPGIHNADLDVSRSRVLEAGTWKKQRVIKITPAAGLIPARVALAHECLIFPPNQGAHRMLAQGAEVGHAYDWAIREVIAHPELSQWEYILTVEADNAPPPDGVLRLIKRMEEHPELSWISGLYWCKGEGSTAAHIWGSPQQDPVVNYRPQPPVAGALIETYGTSMGFCLWRLPMFRDPRIQWPLFVTRAGLDGVGTQDLRASAELRKLGYRCAVDCATLVGHFDYEGKYGPAGMMW